MEEFLLKNRSIVEQMAKGEFAGHVSHEFRASFEAAAIAKGYKNPIDWNCSCSSVENAAKAILR